MPQVWLVKYGIIKNPLVGQIWHYQKPFGWSNMAFSKTLCQLNFCRRNPNSHPSIHACLNSKTQTLCLNLQVAGIIIHGGMMDGRMALRATKVPEGQPKGPDVDSFLVHWHPLNKEQMW